MSRLMRTVLVLLVVWFGMGVAPAARVAAQQAAPGGEIRIGMSVPFTGVFTSQSPLHMNAVRLAEKQINQAGGVNGKKITVIPVDNQSTNPGALAALNKSIEQDKVLALIGPMMSTQILAMSDAIKGYGLPTMIGGSNVTITKQGNPWLFRCRVRDSVNAGALVKYIKEDMKASKIGIVYSGEAYGTGTANLVEQFAKEQGLTLVARERFTLADREFTSHLLRIKNEGAEVLVPLSAGEDELARIMVQYRQLGSPYKFIGTAAVANRATLNLAREAAEGLTGVVDAVPGQSEVNSKYVAEYKKEYAGAEPDMQAAWNYDALNLLANAIRKGGEDKAKIREAILATQGYEGVLGTFNFTQEGEGLHGAVVVVIKNGLPQMVKRVTVNP